MQVTDLLGTQVQLLPSNEPNEACSTLLDGIQKGTILLLLALEASEGWQERVVPFRFLSALSGREIMVYEEADHVLFWFPVPDAANNPDLRERLGQAFLAFIYRFEIVPQGKVIPFNK